MGYPCKICKWAYIVLLCGALVHYFHCLSISEDVLGMGLRFRLYGTERMRRERMIGESIIGFASLSLDQPSTHWVILEPRSNLSVSI